MFNLNIEIEDSKKVRVVWWGFHMYSLMVEGNLELAFPVSVIQYCLRCVVDNVNLWNS